MHRTTVLGISWRRARTTALESFTIPREERTERLPALARALRATELVYVATCNRVEVGFVSDGTLATADQRAVLVAALLEGRVAPSAGTRAWRTWQGEAAAEHILLTTAGLDSALLGEHEIAVQVRDAVEAARAIGLVGPALAPVYTAALRAARRVRSLLGHASEDASLADIALHRVQERLTTAPGAVALVGISPMTEHCARRLAARDVPLVIVNRTLARAEALARTARGTARSLDGFRAMPDPVEAIVLATGAPDPVLSRAQLERLSARTPSGRPPLVVDLGVPPNVAGSDARAAGAEYVGIETITAEATELRSRRRMGLTEARVIVDRELTELRRATAERLVGATIAQLRLRYRQTALEGVDRLFRQELAGLGPQEKERIRQWAETLANRFAHAPSVGLRDLAFDHGPAAVGTFFAATDPVLARTLLENADEWSLEAPDATNEDEP